MAKGNFPQSAVDNMQPETVRQIVSSLRELYDRGKPETDAEIKQRIDDYFAFCERSSIRPGIESLALSLHITRTTLFNWGNGIGCSEKCKGTIQTAKGFISAFLEQATLQGKLNPASSCFMFKNWFNYKDAISIEESIGTTVKTTPARTPEEIAAGYGITAHSELLELPEPPEFSEFPEVPE